MGWDVNKYKSLVDSTQVKSDLLHICYALRSQSYTITKYELYVMSVIWQLTLTLSRGGDETRAHITLPLYIRDRLEMIENSTALTSTGEIYYYSPNIEVNDHLGTGVVRLTDTIEIIQISMVKQNDLERVVRYSERVDNLTAQEELELLLWRSTTGSL